MGSVAVGCVCMVGLCAGVAHMARVALEDKVKQRLTEWLYPRTDDLALRLIEVAAWWLYWRRGRRTQEVAQLWFTAYRERRGDAYAECQVQWRAMVARRTPLQR